MENVTAPVERKKSAPTSDQDMKKSFSINVTLGELNDLIKPQTSEHFDRQSTNCSCSPKLKSLINFGGKLEITEEPPSKPSKSAANKTLPIDYDLNSVGSYFAGEPLTNGFVLTKVNPVFDVDFSYLNRNKLVNRRLTLRKCQQAGSGVADGGELELAENRLISAKSNVNLFSPCSNNLMLDVDRPSGEILTPNLGENEVELLRDAETMKRFKNVKSSTQIRVVERLDLKTNFSFKLF